ncbi:MAG: TolC family protein [Desulfomonile tiedjei]|uniref:TolC family protein n=1 Tax=Desulfomonile tiedjei TaxID=2358 RepID=A0A9D6VA86_9BACT|nr:TolC family protein [Desulfomonile tiedjei]
MGHLKVHRCFFILAFIVWIVRISLLAEAASLQHAQRKGSASSKRLSISQAVETAIARNLRLADSRLAVEEKKHQRRQAYSNFFPSVDLQYTAGADKYQGYIRNDFLQRSETNVEALSGIHPSRWTYRGSEARGIGTFPTYPYRIDPYRSFSIIATLTQPLFAGGRLVNDYSMANLGEAYSSLQLEVDRQDLILDVYYAYYQLLQATRLLEIANDSIRALQAFEYQATAFYREGVNPKADVLAAAGQLAQAYVQRSQARTDMGKAKATLNFLLHRPQETPIEIVENLTYIPSPYTIPDVYTTAAANRVEIRQANISVDQAMALVKSAQADLLPSVSVQLKAARLNDDWNVFDPEGNNDWSIRGVLTWSFDIFRKHETAKEKRTSQAKAFIEREQFVEQVMKDVKQAYDDMKRSENDIVENRKAVAFRKESFRVNQLSYQEQVATYVEVLDAQRQLALAQGDYIISMVGYLINRAVLERKMGILRE